MLRNILSALLRKKRTSPEPRDRKEELEEFRKFVLIMSRGEKKGEVAIVRHDDTTAVVVSELLRLGREHVVMFGHSLPEETFLSSTVRVAMIGFLDRNPEARLTIVTNEPNYRERLLAFEDYVLEGSRVRVLPATGTAEQFKLFSFVVADSDVPSVWYRSEKAAGSEGVYQFSAPEMGPKLQRISASIIAGFGSL